MDTLAARLDQRLRRWPPDRDEQVRQRIAEIIDWADQDAMDLGRSRRAEQEVLNLIDDPTQPGEVWLADLGLAAKTRPVVIVSRADPFEWRLVWNSSPVFCSDSRPPTN